MLNLIRKIGFRIIRFFIPELDFLKKKFNNIEEYNSRIDNSIINGDNVKIYPKYFILNSSIENYTYISENSRINNTRIGKFCSIGPNFMCGLGKHPTNGISTAPMFYSTNNLSNGISIAKSNKFKEYDNISIGNDVFIGANVIILDGVKVGNGAIIGAGSVVSKDIPPYAIAVGSPIKIINYRFDIETINKLENINWWDWEPSKLKIVESYFFDIGSFIRNHYEN